jgi:hypothetical protein
VTGSSPEAEAAGNKTPRLDTSVAHQARIYDYWLGGKDNFAADRVAGDKALEAYPLLPYSVRSQRAFLVRAVRYLASEAGIRQFLDIGPGIPASNNTHEVAQSVAPDSRVVYADNDPVVLLHARALLRSSREGACAYVDADFRDPAKILTEAAKLLDFTKPAALILIGILQLIPDEDDPYGIIQTLMAALPSGSYLTILHLANDLDNRAVQAASVLNTMSAERRTPRSRDEFARFFTGLELVPPGIVQVNGWRPESAHQASGPGPLWVGVARKP